MTGPDIVAATTHSSTGYPFIDRIPAPELVALSRTFNQMVTVCRPRDLGRSEVARWHELQQLDFELQHPFLSPEFALVADQVRGDARVMVVEDGSTIVAFMPFRLSKLRVASPITPGFNDLQALVSMPGLDLHVPTLLASANLRAWTFDHLLSGYPALHPTDAASTQATSTWVIDLPGGWAGYVEWAKAERRRYLNWLERKQRHLKTEAREYQFSYDSRDPAVLRKLMEIKTNQCRAMGWRDMFAEGWVREMFEQLAALRADASTGVLSALRVNGEIVAADFSLRSASIYAGWIIAYDPVWSQLSPGAVRWRHVIEAVADDGIGRIDLGKGVDDFKRRFSTGQRPLREGTVAGSGAGPRLVKSALDLTHKALAPPSDSLAARAARGYRRTRYQMSHGRQPLSDSGVAAE
jgi:CelD/BcsL family acetyltransferase involved in cellulose biosynthesis